ncbi:hypothetical protein L6164_022405 [Bauhinia variegata]|uniref:Uncharacterized protein n=1 Tax=Bauhinia variegata TaxID=167791 RepID=A0ACB9MEX4_BAUVA|nr:hypothetical protein L6164_022405 [Bauhinia variegata]
MDTRDATSLHIAMFPWFAMGHLTPYLHLSNKLARNGHKICFLIPKRTQPKLEQFNLNPHLITFVPIDVPRVDGLPRDAETTSDVPPHLYPLIATAMDRTEHQIKSLLLEIKPNIVFFDFSHWIPNLTRSLGIKSIMYCTVRPVVVAYSLPERKPQVPNSAQDLMHAPPGFPDPSIKLHAHEARASVAMQTKEFGSGIGFIDRLSIGSTECDAVAYRGCREIDGPYVDYLFVQFGKLALLSGPVIAEPSTSGLDEKWATWLGEFKTASLVYCALGSECTLSKDQFQELLLGLELTKLPFMAALKPPLGCGSVEAAFPEGFEERVQGRGIVHGGWVQQQLILVHPSVGCFITHCGAGSISEALVSKCQLVLLPVRGDQIFNARLMGTSLKVGVEVEKGEEDGLFTKESLCKAVKTVTDDDNETGREVRANHGKFREILLKQDLESSYIENFCNKLQDLCK